MPPPLYPSSCSILTKIEPKAKMLYKLLRPNDREYIQDQMSICKTCEFTRLNGLDQDHRLKVLQEKRPKQIAKYAREDATAPYPTTPDL